jgi:hypothetical protein
MEEMKKLDLVAGAAGRGAFHERIEFDQDRSTLPETPLAR